jgi:1,4-dihydroxy-6-naphthoate synthase
VASPLRLEPELADIEALNVRAIGGRDPLDVTKLSLPALARAADRYAVLPAGAALGYGCGPLVVFKPHPRVQALDDLVDARVAIPGLNTTAFLLLGALMRRLPKECVPMRFEQVMPAVASGEYDAGLVIHEARFTFQRHGLRALDLGSLWEQRTHGPLPLGVIAARRDLPIATFRELAALLRASVELARAAPDRPRSYVRAHAQELDDTACDRHVALYVNDFTVDLGATGRAAIERLLAHGRAAGLLPPGPSPFREDA